MLIEYTFAVMNASDKIVPTSNNWEDAKGKREGQLTFMRLGSLNLRKL